MPTAATTVFLFSLLMGGAIGFGIKFFWDKMKKWRFPIAMPTYMQRGNSIFTDLDERGRKVRSKIGYEVIKMMKRKENIQPPQYEYLMSTSKGKPVYPIFNTASGQYYPVKIMDPPKHAIIDDTGAKNWGMLELKRLRETYREKESFFQKYGAFIMNATFAAMVIFFVIYFGGKMEVVSGSLGNAADKLANAMNAFSGNTGGGTVVPPGSQVAPVVP